DEVDVVRLEHFSGRETIVTWTRTAESAQVQIDATSDKGYLVDAYGSITMIRPNEVSEDSAGFYTLFLDGALCNNTDGCPVGGAVSMLIQPHGDITIQEIIHEVSEVLVFD
ncbi:MAG: hypothetical protein H7175_25855, partial [Burkholderiales bacterium]|nr:hypothetical protein [Anaerolineae bacterium]